ncbi:MAG: DUF4363 family protein, partial [Clostridia bacterium]|nr:DUF4363 family protein [Clostridia bacterium]
MHNRNIFIIILLVALIGIVIFEQVYTDNAMSTFIDESNQLAQTLLDEDEQSSLTLATRLTSFWHSREMLISLFVDYRDIETIAKQAELVEAHLENQDFELARVECGALKLAVNNFSNMVSINWHNIL